MARVIERVSEPLTLMVSIGRKADLCRTSISAVKYQDLTCTLQQYLYIGCPITCDIKHYAFWPTHGWLV